jgi:hypothetical protein
MASAKGDGISSRSGLLVGGGGAGTGGGGGGGFSMGSSDYRDTILGEATEMAINRWSEAGGAEGPSVRRPSGTAVSGSDRPARLRGRTRRRGERHAPRDRLPFTWAALSTPTRLRRRCTGLDRPSRPAHRAR